MAARAKREFVLLKRYVDKMLLEMSSKKIKEKAKTDRKLYHRKLYLVVVTDVQKVGK